MKRVYVQLCFSSPRMYYGLSAVEIESWCSFPASGVKCFSLGMRLSGPDGPV